jgi:Ca2+-binding EF-hand superfamily protein
MSDLAVRETILGVLKAKDASGRNIIHSSDFRIAISELGFPMGSPIVEMILVYCKLDNHGNLDFSNLERELARERRVFNANRKPEQKIPPTSASAVSKPWRADMIHHAKVEAEKQLRTVTEHNPEINQLYHALSHHQISSDDVVNALYGLDIVPTKTFMKLVQSMSYSDVSYSDFVRSLTKFDPKSTDLEASSAGGYIPRTADIGDTAMNTQRKTLRVNPTIKSAFFQSDKSQAQPWANVKPVRKTAQTTDGISVTDQMIFKTQKTKQIIFADEDPVALMSHNQQDMVSGSTGDFSTINNVHFNSEMKLQREQVLAALRKLDGGVISMDDFQDLCFSMGIDLPETLLVAISRSVTSGRMDIRRFVKELDSHIFKSAAIDERSRPEEVALLQEKFRQGVRRFGVDSITNLALIFRKMDTDGDGTLTFTEFRQGCNKLQLITRSAAGAEDQLTEEELRRLFHIFDSNGDGVLVYSELLAAIVGNISVERKAMIKKAFGKIDRHGEGKVLIDTLAEMFQADKHPLVTAGQKTAREVQSELVHWLSQAAPAALSGSKAQANVVKVEDDDWQQQQRKSQEVAMGYVHYPIFEQYFASLSAAIEDDRMFQELMTNCFALTDKAPPPPVFKLRQGMAGKHSNETPLAIQTHGDCITWQQEASLIEETERRNKQGRRVIGGYLRNNSNQMNLIRWSPPKKSDANSNGINEENVRGELAIMGITNVSKGQKNQTSGNWMSWHNPSTSGNNRKMNSDVSVTVFSVTGANNDAPSSSSLGLYQEEFASAGGRSHAAQRESASAKLTTSKARDYHTITKPYGVDEDDQRLVANSGNNIGKKQAKSLAELMKAKSAGGSGGNGSGSGACSLAEFIR